MKKFTLIAVFLLIASFGFADDFLKDADLAWTWYPSGRAELTKMLKDYLDSAAPEKIDKHIFAIISPHAAYQFSGSIAAYGFKSVQGQNVKTVIILGFSHRRSLDGVSIYDRGVWRTPLGDIEIDEKLAKDILSRNKRFKFDPSLFKAENSIEMQVPFIQMLFKDAKIVPIAFGTQEFEDVDNLAKALAVSLRDRDDVLIIASTDMSHFHTYWQANTIDKHTIDLISRLDSKALYDEASEGAEGKCELCGLLPVVASIMTAKELGYDKVKILKYANSGDTTDNKTRVVGYLSAAIYNENAKTPVSIVPEKEKEGSAVKQGSSKAGKKQKGESAMLTDIQKKKLLQIARESMANYVVFNKSKSFAEPDAVLNEHRGAFVTLHENGELRGCIGNIIGRQALYKTVGEMAIEAATRDPRFKPLTADEINKVDLEISVLTPLRRVKSPEEIIIPGHGVVVKRGLSSGVFLPQVATETGWSREEFLSTLCAHKAGLSRESWKDPATELYVFSAEVFGEKDIKK